MIKGWPLWAMVALCVLSANGWVLTEAWPTEVRWPFAACIHFGLIGCVGVGFAVARRRIREWPGRRLLALCGAAICLFVVPTAALQYAAGGISESLSATLFCAVPLMTVLAASVAGRAQPRGLMLPALAGLAGAMLLFPLGNPGSPRRWLFAGLVAGACVVVAVASVWMHRLMQDVEIAAVVAVVALGSAAILGVLGTVCVGWPSVGSKVLGGEVLRGAVVDLPGVWLLIWLIREVDPARLSARFLLVPLVTVIEGYAVERGGIGWREMLAMGLLCAGGVAMLLQDEPEELPGLRLR